MTRRRPFRRIGWWLCALVVVAAYGVKFDGMRVDAELARNAAKPELGACSQYLSYLPRFEMVFCVKTVARY